uniref:Uncharacterized protein n=1 Tax=Triticum aestivum TaxID=4565 RepID=A0A3B6NUY4_WHEAT
MILDWAQIFAPPPLLLLLVLLSLSPMPPPLQGAGEGGDRGSRAPAPDPSCRGAGLGQDQGPPPARLHSPSQNPPSSPLPATTVNPFLAAHDADALTRANTGLAFVPHKFLDALGSVAIDEPAVRLLDRARLESWVRALAQGWGPNRPGRYRRHTKGELIDKIDIDMLADDGAASEEEDEKKERVRRV